jgi:hypothetical protein
MSSSRYAPAAILSLKNEAVPACVVPRQFAAHPYTLPARLVTSLLNRRCQPSLPFFLIMNIPFYCIGLSKSIDYEQ